MKLEHAQQVIPPDTIRGLDVKGDNASFIVEDLLPRIVTIRPTVRQVVRWAYGYDQPPWFAMRGSYEQTSDGSSDVPDYFMGGLIKEPAGVGHDFLYELHRRGLADPGGKVWTFNQANLWYLRAMKDFGYPARAVWRYVGLSIGGWVAWNQKAVTLKRAT